MSIYGEVIIVEGSGSSYNVDIDFDGDGLGGNIMGSEVVGVVGFGEGLSFFNSELLGNLEEFFGRFGGIVVEIVGRLRSCKGSLG